MALTDPTQARTTDYDNSTTSYTAGEEPWNKNLDGYEIPGQETESIHYLCDWTKWHGFYRKIPELRSNIDIECRWIIGKKITFKNKAAKDASKRIKGKGKETLRQIFYNLKKVSKICGDGYAWCPRDKAGRLKNIKILDSGTMEIRADKYGIVYEYAQVAIKGHGGHHQVGSGIKGEKETLETFKPEEILHIRNEAIGDEIHGIPEPEKLLDIIKMRHQGMSDNSVIFHRYGKPTYFFEANTDDETDLAAIRDKLDKVKKNFEDAVFPKGTLEKIERVATPQYSSLDPIPWLTHLRSYFTESSGVPELVKGKSDEVSLAAGKLNFVSFKEKIIMQQLEYEEDILNQIGLDIKLEDPIQIDLEISREQEDMARKVSAKRGKGGELQTTNKMPGTQDKK